MKKNFQNNDDMIVGGTKPRNREDFAVPRSTDTTVSPSGTGSFPMQTREQAMASLKRIKSTLTDGEQHEGIERIKARWPGITIQDNDKNTWGV